MESKLIDIPNNELDEIINQNIEQSEKVLIVVSFIFEKGLGLILDKLKKFHNPNNITIITSNYLKSTEPKALRKLLNLKSLGSKIYLFDSLTSNEKFHIKSYYFENDPPCNVEECHSYCSFDTECGGARKFSGARSSRLISYS